MRVKDKSGRVKTVQVKTATATHYFTVRQLSRLLSEVKSFVFSIKKKAKNFLIEGRGFGHHLGMCQWGGREMVRQGKTYQQVLEFYYPGTTFVRLKEEGSVKGGV